MTNAITVTMPANIEQGNLKIKNWLLRWAPSVHRNYTDFKIPFEFHNDDSKQYIVHGRFCPELSHLSLYKKFYDCKTGEERFENLLALVDCWNQMKDLEHSITEKHYA